MKTPETSSYYGLIIFLVAACISISVIVVVRILIKRQIQQRIADKSNMYQLVVDDLLSRLIFKQLTMEEGLQYFRSMKRENLLSKITTQSIIALHQNYTGEQREILENFFVLSELTDYSFKKIKSKKASDILSGIRFLSILNVREAFEFLKLQLDHPNDQVKKAAFVGLISLEGMEGLEKINLPELVIDDAVQDRILDQLKNKRFTSFAGVHHLLYSENGSLVILGARITEQFQLYAYYEYIQTFSKKLQPKYEAELEAIRGRISQCSNL
ncbi:hypothetical protein D3C87_98060 [compost metagenome]